MEVTNTQTAQTAARSAAASEQSSAVISSDFETFLKMLTAQARYQDPLEPIDSSEYAAQLAQFSMVEQQVLSNDLLEMLSTQLNAGNIGQVASWIGMEARTAAAVPFDGSPLTVIPTTQAGSDQAILIAYNADGDEVSRQQISTEGEPVEWTGRRADDTALPEGLYSFKVEHRAVGQTLGVTAAESYARITEARRQGTETVFVLDGGSTVTTEDVSALREPV
ncbi:flagellar hook capping FlgD N-terminal domain-containing protein [Roseobacter sinensis]|uniref:Basal-body rod modification protein FlgD n=1 Tax=Roseobacter sinensis TaxID=2931391 RepID=A0ABT3B8Y9_9RHOB|nr:flagellar hook capping FlgD N-terminal domain-containing protein [Roseobacter sp. WL0113]MCV3269904.1 flagellar biosynthesis protein FlgD [Roseobacter sp. WL0113]